MSFPRPFRILGAAVVTLGAMAAWAPPAWAHANLLGTDPEYGANLDAAPARVVVRYDLPVEVSGAQIKLLRGGQPVRAGRPGYASADHKDVAVPLPKLEPGRYLLAWFLFGSDGDVMGGEVRFTVAGAAVPATGAEASASPGAPRTRARAFAPLSQAQDAARLVSVAGLSLVLGGVIFTAAVWPAGLEVRRTRLLLGASLAAAFTGNAAALGLKGAAVSGQSALRLFSPTALTALNGTHVGRVLVINPGFVERECSFHRFAREDDSCEIRLLQKFHQSTRDRSVMSNHVKQDRAAVSDDHYLAALRFAR